jgi:hypothetical protein
MATYKTRKQYQVRFWIGSEYSRPVGSKSRLIATRKAAQRIVRRLRRAGVEAFAVSLKIAEPV